MQYDLINKYVNSCKLKGTLPQKKERKNVLLEVAVYLRLPDNGTENWKSAFSIILVGQGLSPPLRDVSAFLENTK